MAPPSRALPASWIEYLFSRLSGMYGARFIDQWRASDPAVVKHEWCVELAEFDGPRLRWAIDRVADHYPHPPTAPEFKRLCKQAPRTEAPKEPEEPIDPAQAAAALQRIQEVAAAKAAEKPAIPGVDGLLWVHQVMARARRRESVPSYSVALARQVATERGIEWTA